MTNPVARAFRLLFISSVVRLLGFYFPVHITHNSNLYFPTFPTDPTLGGLMTL